MGLATYGGSRGPYVHGERTVRCKAMATVPYIAAAAHPRSPAYTGYWRTRRKPDAYRSPQLVCR